MFEAGSTARGRRRWPGVTAPVPAIFASAVLGAALVTVPGMLLHERPAGSEDLPDFRQYQQGEPRKSEFFAYLRPVIAAENARIREQRSRLRRLQSRLETGTRLWAHERAWLERLARRYRVPEARTLTPARRVERLLVRVDVIPASLVLVQAAKESAWGTSRFAREGNNIFGEWCFERGCGYVPARRAKGRRHEVETFDSVRESVRSYFLNLNSHPKYAELRAIRRDLRRAGEPLTGAALAEGLEFYSERRQAYVREVQAMIRQNDLEAAASPDA